MKILQITHNYGLHCSALNKRNRHKIGFKGTPECMSLSIDSLENYDKLYNGSYLDIHDDLFAPQNKRIREHNLSFLDNIISDSSKKRFIEHFKTVTGFPNLTKVSENIENEFRNSVQSVALGFNDYKYNVIAAGYDGTCSVGKRMALPGSDLDKAFIILNGDSWRLWGKGKDEEIVNDFRGRLWHATDQRILSYNHDTSFPNIMTINQIKDMIKEIDKITGEMFFDRSKMIRNVNEEYLNLIKASEFNIMLAQKLPKRKYDDPSNALNKENVKNFAYFIESVRDGKIAILSHEFLELINEIKNSDFYKYSNVAQMRATKIAVAEGREQKSKIILRKNLESDFSKWDLAKQFEFVKTLIKYSCEDNVKFGEYFSNDRNIKESYKPLLGLLCYGDKDRRLNPDFVIGENSINLYLNKTKPVTLYRGFNPETLWINSFDASEIEDVLLHVDKLRKTTLFKHITKAQAPFPILGYIPENFGLINYFTKYGRQIIERTLR